MWLIVNIKTTDYLNQSLKSWDLEELSHWKAANGFPTLNPLVSSWGFFWLNIDCASSQVSLIHLREFLTQGTCLLTPSPDNTPPSYFGNLEWARGEGVPRCHLSLRCGITMMLLSESTSLQETPDNPAELGVKSFAPKWDEISTMWRTWHVWGCPWHVRRKSAEKPSAHKIVNKIQTKTIRWYAWGSL